MYNNTSSLSHMTSVSNHTIRTHWSKTLPTMTQPNQTYIVGNKERTIPKGYRISNKFRVFPPIYERLKVIESQSKHDGKPPQKAALENSLMWEDVINHVEKYNSIPSSESDNPAEVLLHKWLLKSPRNDSAKRINYIQQDGVAEWKAVYDTTVTAGDIGKCPVAYVNHYSGRSISANKNTPRPMAIHFDQLVSTAEIATNIKPDPMMTHLKTTENRPGMGK